MGFFSRLFGSTPPKSHEQTGEPTEPAPKKQLLKFFREADIPPDDFVVIDTDACTEEVLEIAAIRYRDWKETDRFHRMIRPFGRIPAEATAINHIGWDDVANGIPIDQAVDELVEFLQDDVIIGYNVGFDIKFLQTRATRMILSKAFDVLNYGKALFPGLPAYKLGDMKSLFGIHIPAHRAMDDCLATAAVYHALRSSPEAEAYRIAQEAEHQAALNAVLDREYAKIEKQRQRETGPSAKELREASQEMTGTPEEYMAVVDQILEHSVDYRNAEGANIFRVIESEEASLRWNGELVFRVKISGTRRYIVLNVPPETMECNYLVTPSSMSEGIKSSRVYIQNPAALRDISEYVMQSFQNAVNKIN